MANYFYSTVKILFDIYAPAYYTKRHSTDKPWFTDRFRMFIRQKQYAFCTGNIVKFRKLCNTVQRLAKKLCNQFYSRQISSLRVSEPHTWWKSIKQFIGLATSSDHGELEQMANSLYDGDLGTMANNINHFFQSVVTYILPLSNLLNSSITLSSSDHCDKFVIEPWQAERKLDAIKTHKAYGPHEILNWFLKEMSAEPICTISMPLSSKVMFLTYVKQARFYRRAG